MTYEEMVLNNENLIYYVLKQLHLYNQLEEYYDIGMIGLCKAAKNYNENFGIKFSTFAVPYIKGTILTHIKRNKNKIHMNAISLNTPLAENDTKTIYLEDTIYDNKFEEELQKKEEIIFLEKALNKLSEEEKQIIYLYFYKELNQIEIGKILNLSQAHISRKINKILSKLRYMLKGE